MVPDAAWVYHLTRKEIALIIQRGGMTTALSRIGMPIPHPRGAFVQDRRKREGGECHEKLKMYLATYLAYGCTLDDVEQGDKQYVPFNLVIQGSNDVDIPKLDQIEEKYLERFKEALPKLQKYDANKFFQSGKNFLVESRASTMLIRNRNHYLTRLAVQYVSYRFKIEETITASHIYFLKPQDAKSGYRDYRSHLGDATIVVLRVKKANLTNLVQDDSEGRAMMTDRPVLPAVIEVMVNHDNFPDEDYRIDDRNWQPLANLV